MQKLLILCKYLSNICTKLCSTYTLMTAAVKSCPQGVIYKHTILYMQIRICSVCYFIHKT